MGVAAAAWAGVAIAGASAAYGAKQNADAEDTNQERFQISRKDYETRLKESAKIAASMESEYNDLLDERPDLRPA